MVKRKQKYNPEQFKDFKFYDIHTNWGLITQILKDNSDTVNELLIQTNIKTGEEYGQKREIVRLRTGEILTPVGLHLELGDYFLKFSDDLWDYANEHENISAEEKSSCNRFLNRSEPILDTIGFNKNDYLPIKWAPYGKCHWYYPVIGRFIVDRLIPDGDWMFCCNIYHTTIVSDKYKLLFDLRLWGVLNAKASTYNMLFGNDYKAEPDEKLFSMMSSMFSAL